MYGYFAYCSMHDTEQKHRTAGFDFIEPGCFYCTYTFILLSKRFNL